VTTVAAVAGWGLALALLVELRRRAALVADAAHELAGPLTAISLGIEALRRQPAARRRADALGVELCRLQLAAEDAAAAARGRRAQPLAAPVPLKDLAAQSSEAWRPAAERRGGRVSFDWKAGNASVHAARRHLAQAFGNLLANAVEHGGGEIVVRGRRSEGGLRIEVEDAGGGPTASSGRPRRGRGRGLGIAARALQHAGGRLTAVDRPDGGRVAVTELPADPAA
jgi:signal transduction histidine kinase